MMNNEYETLLTSLRGLLMDEHDEIANMANAAALLYQYLPDISWAGFYLYKHDELVLGPFQGKVDCMHIPMGKGVCGTAAVKRKILRVDDVHQFSGHIACDSASNSEIVIPLVKENTLLGVLDIDSYSPSRFTQEDEDMLNQFSNILISSL